MVAYGKINTRLSPSPAAANDDEDDTSSETATTNALSDTPSLDPEREDWPDLGEQPSWSTVAGRRNTKAKAQQPKRQQPRQQQQQRQQPQQRAQTTTITKARRTYSRLHLFTTRLNCREPIGSRPRSVHCPDYTTYIVTTRSTPSDSLNAADVYAPWCHLVFRHASVMTAVVIG